MLGHHARRLLLTRFSPRNRATKLDQQFWRRRICIAAPFFWGRFVEALRLGQLQVEEPRQKICNNRAGEYISNRQASGRAKDAGSAGAARNVKPLLAAVR